MLLASVNEILQRLGFDEMTDIAFAATMALDAATPQIEAALNTSFAQADVVDTFYVDRPPYQNRQAVRTRFRLSNGLVSALTSVKVGYSLEEIEAGTPLDVTAKVKLDADRGIVNDHSTPYGAQYVQIAYTSGFAADPDKTESFLLSTIPDWLQEAAKLRALLGLADDASLSEASIKLDKRTLGAQFDALISRKRRYAPTAKMPI